MCAVAKEQGKASMKYKFVDGMVRFIVGRLLTGIA